MLNHLDTSNWEIPAFTTELLGKKHTKYCVVIPVINEGNRIQSQLLEMKGAGVMAAADVIIADGGSKDGSLAIEFLNEIGVNVLLTKTGPGKLSAQLRIAYSYALKQGYEGIVTIDGNGKDGVEAIHKFLQLMDDGWDVVQGSRFISGGVAINTPKIRLFAIKLIHAPVSSIAARYRYTDTTNGFRAYSAKFLLDPRVQPFRNIFVSYELLAYLIIRGAMLGFRCIELPVTRRYPVGEKIPTKISPFRGSIDLITILLRAVRGYYNPK